MNYTEPLSKEKNDYQQTIEKIANLDSAIGIDAQYTHAIIIDYLQILIKKIDKLEEELRSTIRPNEFFSSSR